LCSVIIAETGDYADWVALAVPAFLAAGPIAAVCSSLR
jgi:hypothetical protein